MNCTLRDACYFSFLYYPSSLIRILHGIIHKSCRKGERHKSNRLDYNKRPFYVIEVLCGEEEYVIYKQVKKLCIFFTYIFTIDYFHENDDLKFYNEIFNIFKFFSNKFSKLYDHYGKFIKLKKKFRTTHVVCGYTENLL